LQASFSICTQLYSVQFSSKQYRGLQAWEHPCELIMATYLWACNGMTFKFTILGLFRTCGMQNLGIIGNLKEL